MPRPSGRSAPQLWYGNQPATAIAHPQGSPPCAVAKTAPRSAGALQASEQHQNDNDDQDGADDADAAVSIAVAIAAETATEPTEQEDDQDDSQDESERHGAVLSRICEGVSDGQDRKNAATQFNVDYVDGFRRRSTRPTNYCGHRAENENGPMTGAISVSTRGQLQRRSLRVIELPSSRSTLVVTMRQFSRGPTRTPPGPTPTVTSESRRRSRTTRSSRTTPRS